METVKNNLVEVKVTEETRDIWFALYSAGDGSARNNVKGWTTFDKHNYHTKASASKAAKRCATRLGERSFHYFCISTPYVTDSIEAFKKKCKEVGINPNLSEYESK